ncbi:hypothetical protein U0070_000330, partial [Myodes glareolus]
MGLCAAHLVFPNISSSTKCTPLAPASPAASDLDQPGCIHGNRSRSVTGCQITEGPTMWPGLWFILLEIDFYPQVTYFCSLTLEDVSQLVGGSCYRNRG